MSGILSLGRNSRKSKCNSQGASRGTLSKGGQRSINGVIRLAGFSRATAGHSGSLSGVRESTLVKVILEMS